MPKTLLIVESPAKVKTISKLLGSDYTIRPTVGHIIDLAQGKGGDLGIDIANGFKPRYEVLPDKKDKIKAILEAAKIADEILVASDADREGEAIAFHILSCLKGIDKPIKRIQFGEITKKALDKAIKNPREFNQSLFDAQQARRVLDRIVGFMVSPYLSKKLGSTLSAGRVQSVALRMIIDRDREIEAFVPDVYYNLGVNLAKDQTKEEFVAKYPRRVENEEEATKIKEELDGSTYDIIDIQTNQSYRKPAPPLTTSTLQQEASTKLKFKVDRTMKAAQALYEGGHVTYIRTDAVRNSEESVAEVRNYIKSKGLKAPTSPNEYQNKDGAQDAHEAIRPTHIDVHPDKIAVDEDQQKLYNLIWRMFIASQMTPAVFDTVKVTIQSSVGDHQLIAEGKTLKEEGWREILKPFLKKDKEATLPVLNKKDKLSLVKPGVKLEKSQTKPPARFSEASLVAELERKEIGRPSTYATIISKISSRKYVKDTANGFVPTELGFTVIDNLKDSFSFMQYLYTANMEKKLDDVENGKIKYVDMLTEFFDGFKNEFQKARGEQGMSTGIKCPKCGSDMVVRKSKYGFFAGCVRYKGGCDGIVNISVEDGKVYTKDHVSKTDESIKCPICEAGMVPRPDGKFGPFYSCSNYPKCLGKRKMPFGKKCSKCGNELYATLFNGKLKLACMGYPNCKNIEELPEGSDVNWLDPEKVTPPVYGKKVEKVLKI